MPYTLYHSSCINELITILYFTLYTLYLNTLNYMNVSSPKSSSRESYRIMSPIYKTLRIIATNVDDTSQQDLQTFSIVANRKCKHIYRICINNFSSEILLKMKCYNFSWNRRTPKLNNKLVHMIETTEQNKTKTFNNKLLLEWKFFFLFYFS